MTMATGINRREVIAGLAAASTLPVLPPPTRTRHYPIICGRMAESVLSMCNPVMIGPRLATAADLIPGAFVELVWDEGAEAWRICYQQIET